jgi:hypothetical protein
MKEVVTFFFILIFSLIVPSEQEISLKPYGIKSGIIEYSYSGDKVGKGTLYFDDFGLKSAMYTDAIENGEKRKGWVVTLGEYQYMWDADNLTEGMKLKNPIINRAAAEAKGDIESFTESIYTQMGFTKEANETFLGKDCKVMKGSMGKVLIWNGILMLMDIKATGYQSHQEVTKLQTDIPVEAKHYIIPKNIKFSEMPGF